MARNYSKHVFCSSSIAVIYGNKHKHESNAVIDMLLHYEIYI